ncbi:hypothetical protein CRG98_027458 [Punica granatum]|uniref:Uncharacterized protein n=1 Tax=Punica granatum TaxID=22663 RepID=A0A2I0J7E6_PUNGR|nr:hypothetical protein CRG98_027458 [Punica granatum]
MASSGGLAASHHPRLRSPMTIKSTGDLNREGGGRSKSSELIVGGDRRVDGYSSPFEHPPPASGPSNMGEEKPPTRPLAPLIARSQFESN